jgi:hypothetical protein
LLGQSKVDALGHQVLLHTIVQVPFDPAPFGRYRTQYLFPVGGKGIDLLLHDSDTVGANGRCDEPRAGAPQLLHPSRHQTRKDHAGQHAHGHTYHRHAHGPAPQRKAV